MHDRANLRAFWVEAKFFQDSPLLGEPRNEAFQVSLDRTARKHEFSHLGIAIVVKVAFLLTLKLNFCRQRHLEAIVVVDALLELHVSEGKQLQTVLQWHVMKSDCFEI